jgi:hypothetical protein
MSHHRDTLRQPSLAQHFDAPEEFIGQFGWLCGYSADAAFLDDAAERFTRLTAPQRAHQGGISLALFLDPGSPRVTVLDAPGVAHLPIVDHAKKPFRLLHAKVALLGFRHQENHDKWQLRLLVSTGNWTRQTLEESLDLIWRIDISSESLNILDADVERDCVDIQAAWDLMAWMQNLFDTRLLNATTRGRVSETMSAMKQVRQWITACSEKANGQARFFDNRTRSLLNQLPEKIKLSGDVRRNYLAMGSGFYETNEDPLKPPKVPLEIVSSLRREGLLTAEAEVDLYINRDACQSIATSWQTLQRHAITVRPAAIPASVFGEVVRRSLHAKFLFGANSRKNSNACTSAWVYLGSGNLTHPGFANQMNVAVGNLEAGVVFSPANLYWQKSKEVPDHQVITNLIPIQPGGEQIDGKKPLSAGDSEDQRVDIYIAPPVAWLEWFEEGTVCELRTEEPNVANIQVLDSSGIACTKSETGFHWREAQPRQVRIGWQESGVQQESLIPVVDQYGRIAAKKLQAIETDEAWWQLANFPLHPDENAGDDEDDASNRNDTNDKGKGITDTAQAISYPIRQMMDLIESIAAKQTEIDKLDWMMWCNRLEQALGQAANSVSVQYFRDNLKLNPLSPLWVQSFRPEYAENSESVFGKLYDETLARIEERWAVSKLCSIGGSE